MSCLEIDTLRTEAHNALSSLLLFGEAIGLDELEPSIDVITRWELYGGAYWNIVDSLWRIAEGGDE